MKKAPIIILLFLVIGFVSGCEKNEYDVSPTMEAYYRESVKLPSVTIDSVKSFKNKVDGFTRSYPEALEHNKYPLIKENIKLASIRITLTMETEWAGTDTIRF